MCDASSSSATTLMAACITVSHDTALLCARSATCTLVCSRKEAFVLVSYVQPRGMYKVSPASSSVAYHRNKLACRFANLSRAFLVVSVDVFVHARARAQTTQNVSMLGFQLVRSHVRSTDTSAQQGRKHFAIPKLLARNVPFHLRLVFTRFGKQRT